MSSTTLAYANGHKPQPANPFSSSPTVSASPSSWLQQSTRQFFGGLNWDNQSSEVQQLRQAALSDNAEPLSLTLNVRQFFSAVPWDGVGMAQPPEILEDPIFPASGVDNLTLDDFSDLF